MPKFIMSVAVPDVGSRVGYSVVAYLGEAKSLTQAEAFVETPYMLVDAPFRKGLFIIAQEEVDYGRIAAFSKVVDVRTKVPRFAVVTRDGLSNPLKKTANPLGLPLLDANDETQLKWLKPFGRDWAAAWAKYARADWMMFSAQQAGVDQRLAVLAACDFADLALATMGSDGGHELARVTADTARSWANGEVSGLDVKKAMGAMVDATADGVLPESVRAYDSAYSAADAVHFQRGPQHAALAAYESGVPWTELVTAVREHIKVPDLLWPLAIGRGK